MSNGIARHPLDSPLATRSTGPASGGILDAFGNVPPVTNDPAWRPPTDPLKTGDVKAQARVINREIPLSVVQTGWSIQQVRGALEALVSGMFDLPAQLFDSVVGDSRVQSGMASRSGGLFGRAIKFKVPDRYKDDERAKECLDAWQRVWPQMAAEPVLSDMQQWGVGLGFWVGQILWDTSEKIWTPYPQPWHARYTYYHWNFRRYVALTLDGQVPIEPGDGHWILHAPYGQYRGWMRGAVRSLAPWWLCRNYALRDWARYSERHGMPIIKAVTPTGADTQAIAAFRNAVAVMGQESVMQLPQSEDPNIGKYDIEALEFSDAAWEAFQGLIHQCNDEITMALLGQNLTSEVKEGSLAAARVHADVRQAILEADARAIAQTIYVQLARPFAAINFGDSELAPRTTWDVAPPEDKQQIAQTAMQLAQSVFYLKNAGRKVTNVEELARKLGLRIKVEDVQPTQVEARVAGADGADADLEEGKP